VTTKAATSSERLEQRLAAAALAKLQSRQTPTRQEQAALRRVEAAQEQRQRWRFYRSVPKIHYREMSGRQSRTINEQAERYGLPWPPGKTVDLTAIVKWVHDFLARNKVRLNAPETDDPLLGGTNSAALERYRDERAKLARLERLQKEGELLPREDVHQVLGQIATVLRSAGEILGRQFGADAQDVLNEALDDAQHEIERAFESG